MAFRSCNNRRRGTMGFEIERKFLVRNDNWQRLVSRRTHIRQAYLQVAGKASVRVRIAGSRAATLTIKSRPSTLRRLELEYPIPVLEAEALVALRQGSLIEKTRSLVPCGDLTWEIDVFSDENLGLIIAEIELPEEHYSFELPSWIGREVTGQAQFYNGSLALHPFCS